MKKKIIFSALTALLSASSFAIAGGPEVMPEDYFSGFYVGGIGGVHHNTFNGSSEVVRTVGFPASFPIFPAGVIQSNTPRGGDFNGYGGIQGGFGKAFNQFYLGVVGWGEWGQTSESDTRTAQIPFVPFVVPGVTVGGLPVAVSATASASTSTTFKIKNDEGVAAKLGWIVAPRTMLYGKIGASWANISVQNSVNTFSNLTVATPTAILLTTTTIGQAFSSSGQQTKVGLLLGVGLEQFVYQDLVSVNVEASYVNYGTVRSDPAPVVLNTTAAVPTVFPGAVFNFGPFTTNTFTSASTSARVTSLMAGLNFYFGRNWLF